MRRHFPLQPTNPFIEFPTEAIEQSIPARFDQIVNRYPDRIAIKAQGRILTYAELNHAANRVAHAILTHRNSKEEPIAVLVKNGLMRIVAFLGVLKSGKYFVPMNPSFPRARLAFILRDSGSDLVVSETGTLSLARELSEQPIICLNLDEFNSPVAVEIPHESLSPNDCCYLIYTSGSTGQPKGVIQNQRNMLHDVMNRTNALHLCANDRLAGTGAITTAFVALLNGAAFHPLDVGDLIGLPNWLNQEEITILETIPSVFRDFVGGLADAGTFPRLRLLWLSGERLSQRDVELYQKYFPADCLLLNEFSSTEVASACLYFMDTATEITTSVPPVGYAVKDTEILILKDAAGEADFDDVGEVVVKSPYLALGYWNQPELTRSVFFSDLTMSNGRIYRTGDIGYLLPDGCLVHLGRKDNQSKIRGNRIEVGEIEAALSSLNLLEDFAITSREDAYGNRRLIAYIIPAKGTVAPISGLRDRLANILPDYMVPATFIVLDRLPSTPNGKIDLLGLPARGNRRPQLTTPYAPARTPLEAKLVAIWAQVLNLDQVGIHDNFLDLGGDSLLGVQIISRVIQAFRVEFPIRSLYEASSVAGMADVLRQNQDNLADQEDLDQVLTEVEAMSEQDAEMRLATETAGTKRNRPGNNRS